MNRIILIGNGFDLAHDLKTSYQDFLDSYWRDWINKLHECQESHLADEFYKFSTQQNRPLVSDKCFPIGYITKSLDKISIYPELNNTIPIGWNVCKSFDDIIKLCSVIDKYNPKYKINHRHKNHLFNVINKVYLTKWVDIENEYYKFLNYSINKKTEHDYFYGNIKYLNKDFNNIKNNLEIYLTGIINENKIELDDKIKSKIYSQFEIRDFTDSGVQYFSEKEYFKIENYGHYDPNELNISNKTIKYIDELKIYSLSELKRSLTVQHFANKYFDFKPDNILFLNFNYTNLENLYTKEDSEIIHIHGELNSTNNPIIFGYGDEIGKEYAEIENLNNNEFLENIKSIRYLDTDNYKRLLSFINSDKYQIFIFGHSCGNSDRTLLNTLFENENCVSIKPFYHKRENGTDNYSDITRNISRNFSIKSLMREKVVNKMYCEPLN